MKDMLELGESSKPIVMEGNEAAHHADQFADVAMWRLGYIGDLEPSCPRMALKRSICKTSRESSRRCTEAH